MFSEKNDMPLKDVLKMFSNSQHIKTKLTKTRIIALWERLMGPTISEYTTKVDVRKGTLYLSIESATLRQELSYSKDKIMKMLNEELGENYIKEVIVR